MADSGLVEMVRSVLGRRLTPAQADEIIGSTLPLSVGAQGLICREGDEPAGLLLFLRGSVEILKQGPERSRRVATVEAPTVLGEMSLITDRRRSATVRALTDCEFRLLPRREFLRLLDGENIAAYKLVATIAEVLARRLYRMDETTLELVERRDRAAPVEELAAFREKLFSEWSF